MNICRRRSDHTFWEPSHPSDWTEGDAIASLFTSGGGGFYFRRVRLVRRRWWFGKRWERTGQVWEFTDSGGENAFDVLTDREARRLA